MVMIPQQQPIAKGKIGNNHHRKQRSFAKAKRAKRNLQSKIIIGNNSQETVDLTPQEHESSGGQCCVALYSSNAGYV